MINERRYIEKPHAWSYAFTAYKNNIPVYVADHCGNLDYFERKARKRIAELGIDWDEIYIGQCYIESDFPIRYSCSGIVKKIRNSACLRNGGRNENF